MTATYCEIWFVTDSRNKDAVALSAIHRDITAKDGRGLLEIEPTVDGERGAARPF